MTEPLTLEKIQQNSKPHPKIEFYLSGANSPLQLYKREAWISSQRCLSVHYTVAMFLIWFASKVGLAYSALRMIKNTNSLSGFL